MTAPLENGDAIQFRLAVTGDSARIIALRELPDTAVSRNPARTIMPIDTWTFATGGTPHPAHHQGQRMRWV